MNTRGAGRTAASRASGWVLLGSLVVGCSSKNVVGDENTGGQTPQGGALNGTGGVSMGTGGMVAGGAASGGVESGGAAPGGAASGGAASGGTAPQATGGYWTGPQSKTDKVDLLLVVDNSLSMADKQAYLQSAVPAVVQRLVAPNCYVNGQPVARVGDACPTGATSEFSPVHSLHVGVVSSSLGARGKPCSPGAVSTPRENDRGHLIGPDRDTESTQAVIAYEAGIDSLASLTEAIVTRIVVVGEQGCGFESTQEAWYRFLVDPQPPETIILDPQTNLTVAQGIDQTVLQQRAAFLRPDSAVVIMVLSDEDDCSMIDYGQGWLTASESRLPRGTSACAINPQDKCCFSCRQAPAQVPAGCPGPVGAASVDSACQIDANEGYGAGVLAVIDDAASLRCWETKRRFGFDLLFDLQRYLDGLTNTTVPTREVADGKAVMTANPLFASGRDPSLVTLVGIVGVPWQDLATSGTVAPAVSALELMDYASLASADRWNVMLGSPSGSPPVDPTDPFMLRRVDERAGTNPITSQSIVPSSSNDPQATINGHEVNSSAPSYHDDLQYACTFELPTYRDCTLPEYTTNDPALKKGCDCKTGTEGRNRPLCQPPGGGDAGTTQYFAKAYPGSRHLELLKGLGPRGITGSVCPKFPKGDTTAASYGYNPVASALMTRLRQMLK